MGSRRYQSSIKKTVVRLDLGWYWFWAAARVVLTLAPQTGYIHPDEFFQTVEVFAGNVFNVDVNVPWEYNPKFPLRSIPVMYALTSFPLTVLRSVSRILGESVLTPYFILVIPRLAMCVLSFISDYCLYRICYMYGQNFRRRLIIFASSYVMLTYATRTFSNSVEMVLFNVLLLLVAECMAESEKINYQDDFLKNEYNEAETTADRVRIWKIRKMLPSHSIKLCFAISAVTVTGIFNRATFIIFAIPPVFYWLQRGIRRDETLLHFHVRFFLLILYAIPVSLVFIYLDSAYYGYITWGEILNKDIGFHSFVVTPLNFLRYNLVSENVSQHGLHPRWLHILVNLPLLFNLLSVAGTFVMVNMVYRGSQMYWTMLPRPQSITSMMTLSIIVPVVVLSVIPHQEPRFLTPLLLPLVFLYSHLITRFEEDCQTPCLRRQPKQKQLPFFDAFDNRPNIMGRVLTYISTQAVTGRTSDLPEKGHYELINVWYAVNIILAGFYGFVHQGGVYPLLKSFRAEIESQPRYTTSFLYYSHTYTIPQHLLMRPSRSPGSAPTFHVNELGSDFSEIIRQLETAILSAESVKRSRRRNYRIYYALPAQAYSFFELAITGKQTVYRQCKHQREVNASTEVAATNSTTPPVPTPSPCLPPWSAVPENTFPSLWRIVYWSSQFLTWIIMPLMQSYTQAGEFTVTGKLRSAAIDNAIYYGTYLLIAGILLIYIATKPGVELDWPKLKAIASSASNTWGLFLLVLLLGHGLVEIPRSLWNHSKPGYSLRYAYFRVAKTANEKSEAEYEISNVIESLREILSCVHVDHPFYKYVQEIRQNLPAEINSKLNVEGRNMSDVPSEKMLARVHKQLKKALQKLHRTEAQYNAIVAKTVALEDIDRNCQSHNRRFKATFPSQRNAFLQLVWSPPIEWYYRCVFHKWILRGLAIVSGILSVAVVWSEVTFFNASPVLSLFAIFLDMSIQRYDYYAMELTSTCIIAYLCYCAYSTVLKIKFLNKYYITSNHQTDEFSLIFSGMMACRLTPAMCLNFLGMIHMDSHVIRKPFLETAYTQIMGHMDVVSIISDGFNVYFPMLVLILCLASYFSLGSRLLSKMGFPQFVGDELTQEWVDDGKSHISREKRLRQRMEEAATKRRELENYGGGAGEDGDARGRARYTREPDRAGTSRGENDDPAKTSLLSDQDQFDYYVQPSGQRYESSRDRSGKLPKNFFDDV